MDDLLVKILLEEQEDSHFTFGYEEKKNGNEFIKKEMSKDTHIC